MLITAGSTVGSQQRCLIAISVGCDRSGEEKGADKSPLKSYREQRGGIGWNIQKIM